MAVTMTMPLFQFFDDNGVPLAGGKIYAYESGTTTPKDTYTDSTEATPNSNPIVLDSAGRCPLPWINGSYKFIITDSNDVQIGNILDGVTSFSTLSSSGTSSAVPIGSRLCPVTNLVGYRASASTYSLSADKVVLRNVSGTAAEFSSLSVLLDITSTGAGKLDTGTEAISTWYHIWGIGKTDGTVSAVFSTSSSAPTLPSGYTYYGYLGAIYNSSSGDFRVQRQTGDLVDLANVTALSVGTATSYTAVDLSTYVPPTAKAARLSYGIAASSGTATVSITIASYGSGTTATYGFNTMSQITGATSAQYNDIVMPFNTAKEVYYFVSGANANGYIKVTGWVF